jgi:hypothetical protein
VRFLFTTIQFVESDFYGRVSRELARLGHESVHVVISRRSAEELWRAGFRTFCLPDLLRESLPEDLPAEISRIESVYELPSLRDVYFSDWALAGRPEHEAVARTVRHFLALERVFDEVEPEVVVPEVGSETMRTVAYLLGRERRLDVLFLFYTIFPRPLRLYRNTFHAPIVPPEEMRDLSEEQREEVETFIRDFTARARPTLAHRHSRITKETLRGFFGHIFVRATVDGE